MRFKNYLNEEDIESLIEKLEKDCKPFLEKVKNLNNILVRQSKKAPKGLYDLKTVHINRNPRDTPIFLHKKIDNYLEKKYGWKARSNGLFCWSTKKLSKVEKNPRVALVFPIGNFDFLWNPEVSDLYQLLVDISLDLHYRRPEHLDKDKDFEKLWNALLEDKTLDEYTNKNLEKALQTENEIIINCDRYYYVNMESEFLQKLEDRWNVKLRG